MKVLGIDSATPIASVAILDSDTGRVLAAEQSDAAGHRADLLVTIDAACKAAKLAPTAIEAVAIGAGPGSFTGLRIGMATAKGIAFAAGRPLWAVSSLAALAQGQPDAAGLIVAVLDARRGEIYAGAYRRSGATIVPVGDERVFAPAELASFVAAQRAADEPITYVGDADYPELAALPGVWHVTPTGESVARLALAGSHVNVLVGGAPSYIRPSEAEIRYPDGVPGALRKR
ncbi:MAG: tRNA (adenosine(37)-N6)-threonylcarbamoyltransferase complex dimerization subunit type 1 TsaB [Kofleriaceae bacterium]|nr:tRNA (adenosine(37)-N6)-threonylcarbamoyltransferase complex dimerization subunit type 1 TsaB [Kofleriaceae bacterium]